MKSLFCTLWMHLFLNFAPILVLFCPKLCSDFKDNVPQYLSLFNGYFGGALKEFGSCGNSD